MMGSHHDEVVYQYVLEAFSFLLLTQLWITSHHNEHHKRGSTDDQGFSKELKCTKSSWCNEIIIHSHHVIPTTTTKHMITPRLEPLKIKGDVIISSQIIQVYIQKDVGTIGNMQVTIVIIIIQIILIMVSSLHLILTHLHQHYSFPHVHNSHLELKYHHHVWGGNKNITKKMYIPRNK